MLHLHGYDNSYTDAMIAFFASPTSHILYEVELLQYGLGIGDMSIEFDDTVYEYESNSLYEPCTFEDIYGENDDGDPTDEVVDTERQGQGLMYVDEAGLSHIPAQCIYTVTAKLMKHSNPCSIIKLSTLNYGIITDLVRNNQTAFSSQRMDNEHILLSRPAALRDHIRKEILNSSITKGQHKLYKYTRGPDVGTNHKEVDKLAQYKNLDVIISTQVVNVYNAKLLIMRE